MTSKYVKPDKSEMIRCCKISPIRKFSSLGDKFSKLKTAIEFSMKVSSAVDKLEVEKKNQKPIPMHVRTAPVIV